jgi:hypothetical protein
MALQRLGWGSYHLKLSGNVVIFLCRIHDAVMGELKDLVVEFFYTKWFGSKILRRLLEIGTNRSLGEMNLLGWFTFRTHLSLDK